MLFQFFQSVQPESTSEMSQASSPGIDILAPAIAGSIILILIAVGVTGFIYKRNKHAEYIVAKGGAQRRSLMWAQEMSLVFNWAKRN